MKLRFLIELSHALNYFIVSREDWKARPPKQEPLPLSTPVPYVVIHHTSTPTVCHDKKDCSAAMRQLQNRHMDKKGWSDIGFHFAICNDGEAYEGCGWDVLCEHAPHFNTVSLGITLIGDRKNVTPPPQQLLSLKALLSAGVEMNYIRSDYKLIGHYQVTNTDCPGAAVRNLLRSWDHYSSFPSSYKDLINVQEISESEKQLLLANLTY